MKKWMSLLAAITFAFTIYMNYLAGTGAINGVSVADISDRYATLITPAGYTFSIWGLIYIGLTVFTVYQLQPWWLKEKEMPGIHSIRLLFIGTNVLNGVWVLVWLNDQIGLSMLLMILLFMHLLVILMNIDKTSNDKAYRWMLDIPFQIYAGWITVALIVNLTVFLKKYGVATATPISESLWAVFILMAALVIFYGVMRWRKYPAYGLVGSWATAGIAVAQWNVQYEVGWTAAIVSFLLFILSVARIFRK